MRTIQCEAVLNCCYICEKRRLSTRGFLRREYIYSWVDLSLGSTSDHTSYWKPCGDTLSADLCEIRTAGLLENFVSRAIAFSHVRKVARVSHNLSRSIHATAHCAECEGQISSESFAFVKIPAKNYKLGLCCDTNEISATTHKISTLESSGKRKSQLCKFITRSRPCARWLLSRQLRVCAGLHKVFTCEPCIRSKVDTGGFLTANK